MLITFFFAFLPQIGDCYVAACGVPEPNSKHAVIMAKFASDCIKRMSEIVKELSVRLGPETESLKLRVGLHSGPGRSKIMMCWLLLSFVLFLTLRSLFIPTKSDCRGLAGSEV